jgi:hypothetical protein
MPRVESFEFVTRKGVRLALDGTLLGWDAEVTPTLAEHLILYRSGAIHQWQGQGPRRFTYRCLLQEPGATDATRQIETAVAQEPFGTLIDPRFGHVTAIYAGLKSTEEVDVSTNTKQIEISFSETTLRQVPQDTPASAAAAAGQASAQLQQQVIAIPAYVPPAAAVDSSVVAFQAVIEQVSFVQADLTVALAQVDYTTQQLLGLLGIAVANAYLAAQARLVFGRCLYAYNLAGASQPRVITRYVDQMISLPRLCVLLYGGGAQAVEDQIYDLNRISTPYAIPIGTRLLLPDPAAVSL